MLGKIWYYIGTMEAPISTFLADAFFNIGAVTRMTGIPVASLHAWERRYGFPHSLARTQGGHRLYSERDVTLLRCVKAQIDQGVSARQAVVSVQKMEAEGRLPTGRSVEAPRIVSLSSAPLALREQLTGTLLRNDLEHANQLMGEMLAFYTPEEMTLNVIGPALNEIGEAWEQGRITVAMEHLATNYLRHRLLMWMVTGPTPRDTHPIVLACAPGEWHDGSLLMMGVLLRRQGWPVAYLGQNMPFADLADFVRQIHPAVVVLVAMREESGRSLAEWPKWIPIINGRPIVAFGGRAFVIHPELQNLVPGKYLGDTVHTGLMRLVEMVQ
jgi:DNA-binding transcriptional MerR regulator